MLEGLYIGNDMAMLPAVNRWLGKPIAIIGVHTGRANWPDWTSSIDWQIRNVKPVAATPQWTIPLFAVDGNLADAARHKYDQHYVDAARKLAVAYGTSKPILVRTGEEFNGSWMPWAASGKATDFAQAYRNFVTAFRSVSPNFKFEWNVNIGESMDPAIAYPGDQYVDYIGMDFYWDSKKFWSTADPVEAFNYARTRPHGLQWLENFAAAHRKPSAYSEWGINSVEAGPYIKLVRQWFDAHNVAYELYWDSDGDFAGRLDNGQYGKAGDVFRMTFGARPAAAAAQPAGRISPRWVSLTKAVMPPSARVSSPLK